MGVVMRYTVGDAVRLRDGSALTDLLAEAAALTGTVGDAWSDDRGEWVHVVYEGAGLYVSDLPAGEFVGVDR